VSAVAAARLAGARRGTLHAQRPEQDPEQEQQAEHEHGQPQPEVDPDAVGLGDLRVVVEEPGDGEDQPVEHEQAADEGAQVEQPGRGRVARVAVVDLAHFWPPPTGRSG